MSCLTTFRDAIKGLVLLDTRREFIGRRKRKKANKIERKKDMKSNEITRERVILDGNMERVSLKLNSPLNPSVPSSPPTSLFGPSQHQHVAHL